MNNCPRFPPLIGAATGAHVERNRSSIDRNST
jgi:hypothetical protein